MQKEDLFVAEDEEMSDSPPLDQYEDVEPSKAEPEEEDDPIIQLIPLIHGKLPARATQSLHVLQFAGRPHSRPFATEQLSALLKPESKVVELKVPMETAKFYDEARAAELGVRVEHTLLQGVLTDSNGGLYVGHVVEKDGQSQIVLFPLDSTAQMKALFQYIDDLETARTAQVRQDIAADAGKPSAVQVLQTALKLSAQIVLEGQIAGGFGLCLKHVKRFNEEDWVPLDWRSGDSTFRDAMDAALTEPIEARTQLDEFL